MLIALRERDKEDEHLCTVSVASQPRRKSPFLMISLSSDNMSDRRWRPPGFARMVSCSAWRCLSSSELMI